MNDTVDIRPSLGDILDGYQRLSYQPETAIAEFVDNSTASYYDNKALFDIFGEKLTITINYDQFSGSLEIRDTAWGMDKNTFADALTIAKRPQNTNGRNEYGMGLKTAASWFGKKWTVITKTANNNKEYTAVVDINNLVQTKQNSIAITAKEVNNKEHYTIIKIQELNKRITERTLNKLIKELSSIYRSDINSSNIDIYVNDHKLTYELPEILSETLDGITKVWKKDISDNIIFDGKQYNFTGFVALRKVGNYKESGFALLRRGRIIIGGTDKNFKPQEIFGSSNSFQSLRIFGEIHLDNWPVTQAKDNFDWDMDGLKDAFIDKLTLLVNDYIIKAKNVRKTDKSEEITITVNDAQCIGDETYEDLSNVNEVSVSSEKDVSAESLSNEDNDFIPSYSTNIKILDQSYKIQVSFIKDDKKEFVTVTDNIEAQRLDIEFNTVYHYFNNINDKESFTRVFQKYLILHIIAEKYLTRISTNDGLIYPYQIRETLSRMLEEIKDGKNESII